MIEIYTKEILYVRERLYEILADHTNQPVEKIARDADRDYFMSADEARDYGIVDKVIKSRREIHADGKEDGDGKDKKDRKDSKD
jgi:ATP-dependent Clp protease protease subunit